MRSHLSVSILFLVLVPVLAAEPEDEVRDVVKRYFTAFAAKDLDSFMALWSDKAADYKSRKQTTQRIFAETGDIQLKEMTVIQAEAKEDAARVRVRVALAGLDKRNGKPHRDLGKLNRVLILKKEEGAWNIWRYVPAEQEMLERLLAAKDKAARQKLYEDNKDLLTSLLVGTIQMGWARASKARRFDEALRLNELAFEAIELCSDKSLLPYCHTGRAANELDQLRYREAVADYERAVTLFRQAKNRVGEASALRLLGQVFVDMGRSADALRSFQDSWNIYRELGDRGREADVLNQLGIVRNSLRRYAEALRAHQDCLKIARELGDREREGRALLNLGVVYADTHRYAEALRAYEECLKIVRALGHRVMEGEALNNLGNVYGRTGRYAEALRVYPDSLKIARELGDRKGESNILNGMGIVYRHTSRYEEALRVCRDSLKIARELSDREREAETLATLGVVYSDMGRYAEALRHYQHCLKLARERGDRWWEAGSIDNIAGVYMNMGRFDDALRQFQVSLKIARELDDRSAEGKVLHGIGVVYEATGRYAEALRCFQDSLKIARALGERAGEAKGLHSLGSVYRETGLYDEALRSYQDSLKIEREVGDRAGEASSLDGIGLVYRHTGRYTRAVRCHQDSLRIRRDIGDRAGAAASLSNMGVTYKMLGRGEEALRSYQDSLQLDRELGNRTGEAIALLNIGNVYKSTGRYREALASYAAGRELAESIGHPSTVLRCHWGIGDVHRARKQWLEAVAAYRRTLDLIEQGRDETRELSLKTSFLSQHTLPYHGLAVCLLELGRPAEAFAVAEQAKARALLDVLRAGKADVRKGMTADERQQEQRLQERLTVLAVELENLRSHKLNPPRQTELARALDKTRQDNEAFRRELFLRRPELQARRGEFAPAPLADLGRELFAAHPKLLLLSYLVEEKETLLFVLRSGERPGDPARLTVHRIEVGETALAEGVEQFRDACRKPGGGTPDGSDLYRWLLAPVEDLLAEVSQVIVVPDGPLHSLPLHALKDGEEGKYLLQRCAVSYAPSATALRRMAELGRQRHAASAASPRSVLAVGVSDFGPRAPRLPAAEREAQAVAGLFGEGVRPLLGREATKAALRAAWAGRRYLHFATHGRLNESSPLYSAVVLNRADERDEGLLFARDLLDEELTAELVVLSACETGLGQQRYGEGLLGMTWGWFVAGVPATVASQWSVDDDSTARLMQVFYTELKGGAPKAEALRRAQLALLKDRKTRHPFYWAPFALSGDPW